MKLINAFYAVLSVIVATATWQFLEPLIALNGNSVITVMSPDKRGAAPMAIKLPEFLSPKQHELLNFAYDVAKTDGMKHPQYLQGIIMQESLAGNIRDFRVAGITNSVGDRYFGIGQVKLVAAKAVMNRFPEMWKHLDGKTDEELQARLILDDHFNIRVSSKYAMLLGINSNPTFAITAYNRGPGGALLIDNPGEFHYTQKVKAHAEKVKNVTKADTDIKLSSDTQKIQVALQ